MARRDARRDSGRALQRRGPTRDPLPYILVVCEGKVTEPQYINGFKIAHGVTTVRLDIHSSSGNPLGLVERAIELRDESVRDARRADDENLAYDQAWCVVDVDEHPRLDEARALAARSRIELAVSNPCFELWLLLHFADQTGHLSCSAAVTALRRHLSGYDKHLRFGDLANGYEDAVRRARALDKNQEKHGAAGGNPSTGVHGLMECIRQNGQSARLER
ncbi:RloB family protein [Longimicrobium terrae]|uniref:RloB family protein n=1 Tax=Longimicrobium terrae TaxID=1639882 RepID=UPI0014750F60|nr:RloB family protein [Longimicrobium terrae]NNC30642.1 RloB domain-containing protein [Longimicrobium terrae]